MYILKIQFIVKNIPKTTLTGSDGFLYNFFQTFKEKIPIIDKLLKN